MTAPALRRGPSRAGRRAASLLGYDGIIATMLMRILSIFVVSVSFLACLVPAVLFQLVVGWQGTHLALWLGALSVLPLFPAVSAVIAAAGQRLLLEEADGAGRVFWSSFARASRTQWPVSLAVSAVILVLAYDFVLFGSHDAAFIAIAVALAMVVVLIIAVASAAANDPSLGRRTVVVRAVRAVARRPHIGLCWLLLIAAAGAASTLPIVGGAVVLSAPALVACGVVVCNRALGLFPRAKDITP